MPLKHRKKINSDLIKDIVFEFVTQIITFEFLNSVILIN
jgi:hypothetical protein